MGADHLLALAVVAAPGAADAEKASSTTTTAEGDDEDEDEDEDDVERRGGEGEDVAHNPSHPPHRRRRRRRHAITTKTATSLRLALRSFLLGLQWGAGHSIGLAAVCAVFFATRRRMNLDDLGARGDDLGPPPGGITTHTHTRTRTHAGNGAY